MCECANAINTIARKFLLPVNAHCKIMQKKQKIKKNLNKIIIAANNSIAVAASVAGAVCNKSLQLIKLFSKLSKWKRYKFREKSKFINVNICRIITTTIATQCIGDVRSMAEMHDYILTAGYHPRCVNRRGGMH